MLKTVLEFLVYALLISLLGAPFALIVIFPSQADEFTQVSETLIPWLVVLIISVIYVDGIRGFISKLATTLSRVTKLSAGGAAVELHSQDVSTNLTPEQADAIKASIQSIYSEKQGATDLASHFFLKYVGATVFGSQVRFLENLDRAPLNPNQAISFYNEFLSTLSPDAEYSFELWVKYLTENFLIQFNSVSGDYEITQAGRNFVTQARGAGLDAGSWKN
jgi:hypothetical protein